jgi:hypothetical protein
MFSLLSPNREKEHPVLLPDQVAKHISLEHLACCGGASDCSRQCGRPATAMRC